MKTFFNIYFLSGILISGVIFFLSYQLRLQPIYRFKVAGEKLFNGKTLTHAYSQEYIQTIKTAYFPDTSVRLNNIPDDSLFVISMHQVIRAGFQGYFDFPTINYGTEKSLVSSFHVKAKKNFDITLDLKKKGDTYVCDKIYNLPLLLYYYPQNRKAFEKFISINKFQK